MQCKLTKADQLLVRKGLKSTNDFVRDVAESIQKYGKISDRQRLVLQGKPLPVRTSTAYDDEYEHELGQLYGDDNGH